MGLQRGAARARGLAAREPGGGRELCLNTPRRRGGGESGEMAGGAAQCWLMQVTWISLISLKSIVTKEVSYILGLSG